MCPRSATYPKADAHRGIGLTLTTMTHMSYMLALVVVLMLLGAVTAVVVEQLAVSREAVVVPDVRGLDVVTALDLANRHGLGLQVTARVVNTAHPSHAILTQDPQAGRRLQRGGLVRVVVSTGLRPMTVPAVQGLVWQDAKATLERDGARLGDLLRIHSDRVPRDRVIAQSPPGDAKSIRGRPVALLVSEGPWPVSYVMPDLRGASRAVAEALMTALGLRLQDASDNDWPEARAGSVVDQQPSPGQRVAPGQEVQVVLTTREPTPTSRVGTGGDPPRDGRPPPMAGPPVPPGIVPPAVPMVWFYCHHPMGYYPFVRSCPGGWTPVIPPPPPPDPPRR
jgi:beta-lactam-binding protein with PASTA domain